VPVHTFRYSGFAISPSEAFPNDQTAWRPLLIARISKLKSSPSFKCITLPDSGADHCIFPLSFAGPIGFDRLKMKMQTTGGLGGLSITYYGDIEIEIFALDGTTSLLSFVTCAGFTGGLETQGFGLLGQCGFFENFRVAFNHQLKLFTIESV
jgi:hypothetical protein